MQLTLMNVINILSVLLSPVIAVLVTIFLQNRSEKTKNKLQIFSTLLSTRHSATTEETVRAYNMIDVVFYDNPNVRRLWREYYDILGHPVPNYKAQQDKKLELIYEMAKVLGYAKSISTLDIDRCYYPNGLAHQAQRNEETANEVLRVLKASNGLSITPNNEQSV